MKSIGIAAFFVCATAFGGVVQPLTSAPQVLIPAAGSTPGANGTFFRSDITIVNFADHSQNILLRWLPQGVTGTSTMTITIISRGLLHSSDFVREILAQSGLGAIVVTGVTSAGDPDPAAALYVQSRVWTPQPGTSGTTSQSLPAIPVASINTTDASFYSFGALNGSFRANIGIVNLDPANTQTFSITNLFTPIPAPNGGIPVTIPPLSMQQVPIGSGQNFFLTNYRVTNTTPSQRSNTWITYASIVDNVTGDAWSELGVTGGPPLCCGPIWK